MSSLVLDALAGAVPEVGRALDADRCWLYARDPGAGAGIALVRWLRDEGVADVPRDVRAWSAEPPDLRRRDPLFGRALDGVALDGVLWGVLQPGMTTAPRRWTAAEREALLALRPALAPLVAAAVRDRPPSRRVAR